MSYVISRMSYGMKRCRLPRRGRPRPPAPRHSEDGPLAPLGPGQSPRPSLRAWEERFCTPPPPGSDF